MAQACTDVAWHLDSASWGAEAPAREGVGCVAVLAWAWTPVATLHGGAEAAACDGAGMRVSRHGLLRRLLFMVGTRAIRSSLAEAVHVRCCAAIVGYQCRGTEVSSREGLSRGRVDASSSPTFIDGHDNVA